MGLSCKCCYHNLSHYTFHWEEAFSVRLCWECIRPWVELGSDSNPGFLRSIPESRILSFSSLPWGWVSSALLLYPAPQRARADWNLTWKSTPPDQSYRFYFSRLWQTGEAAPGILQSPHSSSCRAAPSTKFTEKEHSASTQCSAPGNQVSQLHDCLQMLFDVCLSSPSSLVTEQPRLLSFLWLSRIVDSRCIL